MLDSWMGYRALLEFYRENSLEERIKGKENFPVLSFHSQYTTCILSSQTISFSHTIYLHSFRQLFRLLVLYNPKKMDFIFGISQYIAIYHSFSTFFFSLEVESSFTPGNAAHNCIYIIQYVVVDALSTTFHRSFPSHVSRFNFLLHAFSSLVVWILIYSVVVAVVAVSKSAFLKAMYFNNIDTKMAGNNRTQG